MAMSASYRPKNKEAIDFYLSRLRILAEDLEALYGELENGDVELALKDKQHEFFFKVNQILDHVAYELWLYQGRKGRREKNVYFPCIIPERLKDGSMESPLSVKQLFERLAKYFPGLIEENQELFLFLLSIQPSRHTPNPCYWLPTAKELSNIPKHRFPLTISYEETEYPLVIDEGIEMSDENLALQIEQAEEIADEMLSSIYSKQIDEIGASYVFQRRTADGEAVILGEVRIEGLPCDPLIFMRIVLNDLSEICATCYDFICGRITHLPRPEPGPQVPPPVPPST